jgi:hypothetical protein
VIAQALIISIWDDSLHCVSDVVLQQNERLGREPTQMSDPSTGLRCQINTAIEYNLIRGRKVLRAGRGTTVYISRHEIVFRPEDPIPARLQIEASVSWPAALGNAITLRLHVHGETVETESGYAAIKIAWYEFRTTRASLP